MLLFDFKCEGCGILGEYLVHREENEVVCRDCRGTAYKKFTPTAGRALFFEEARTRTMDARERVERAEKLLSNLESTGEIREELVAGLQLLELPLGDFLEGLPSGSLTRLCRAVFRYFSIQMYGVASRRAAVITGA